MDDGGRHGTCALRRSITARPSRNAFPKAVALPWILFGFSVISTLLAFFVPTVGREYDDESADNRGESVRPWANPVVRACTSDLRSSGHGAGVRARVPGIRPWSRSWECSRTISFTSRTYSRFLLVAHVSKEFIETGFVPLGGLGVPLHGGRAFTHNPVLPPCSFFFFLATGFFGGLIVVTLNSLLQFYTRPTNGGRILAVNNLVQVVALESSSAWTS